MKNKFDFPSFLLGVVPTFCVSAIIQGCENFTCTQEPPELFFFALGSALFSYIVLTMYSIKNYVKKD